MCLNPPSGFNVVVGSAWERFNAVYDWQVFMWRVFPCGGGAAKEQTEGIMNLKDSVRVMVHSPFEIWDLNRVLWLCFAVGNSNLVEIQ